MATLGQRVKRAQSLSTSGGPLVVSYAIETREGGRIDIELPHTTTRRGLARRLRRMADAIEVEPLPLTINTQSA